MAEGPSWGEASGLAELAVAVVVRAIREAGLEVAPQKTQAMFFFDHRRALRRAAPRLEGATNALSRLLPNLGGPETRVRRLLVGAVRSIALYGAPVWAEDLAASRRALQVVRAAERRLAGRVVRAYRTVSHRAALALAGTPPVELLAEGHANAYLRRRDLRERGVVLTARAKGALREQGRRAVLLKWQRRLADPGESGRRVAGAVQPILCEWVDRGWGTLTYRTTQVLSGHGCFGEFLCRIGKERGPHCHHCGAERDTADHTLAECAAWGEERRVLKDVVGEDLSLPTVMRKMVGSERNWRAVSSFCEQVMLRKEEAERERRPGVGRRGPGHG
ncbi:uncharacterized protein LOC113563521 [Ooceraea biroi]|uniref:uncharacterized protein LOC113563521 n=1 Tax=Ooceraea biroi TaxID=2015173 RepID=UPI000F07C5BE|nr:uncharacterized protein LOC113563521 [Ooceraea biroi]